MEIENEIILLPFEKYTHVCDVDEYKKDIKKKNLILKYIDLLTIDPKDTICLDRLISCFIVIRNVFCKEACLEFFLESFNEEQLKLSGKIIFDMFVVDNNGEICEYKEFLLLAIRLNKIIDYKSPLIKSWTEIKKTKI